ncbi:MAG TPA: VWA domain-containing protein [Kofleriaceae bacterium]
MSKLNLALAGMVLVCLEPAATAQPIATDRLSAVMIATDHGDQLPVFAEKLVVDIDGQHAHADLMQTFSNRLSQQIEGHYQLQPGQGSHVDGFAYWNGEQKIVGEVFEKATAERVYTEVTTRRRDPAILEQTGEGLYGFKVFPIAPNERKRVEIAWSKWLERRDHTVEFRAPVSSRNAEIIVTLAGPIKNLTSATHVLTIEKLDNGLRVRATGPAKDGEIDLRWDVDEPAWTPDAYVQPPTAANTEGWFVLALAAPQLPATAAMPKDVTIVIDRSGSMAEDEKMTFAKRAAGKLIDVLDPHDRVNVIAFSDEVDPLFAAPHVVDAAARGQAKAFVDRLLAGGGTDLALALQTAVHSQTKAEPGRPRIVVFLTDGESDAQKAVAVDTSDLRLFTLGVGVDVNKALLAKLAAEKRGRFVYIERASEIEGDVARLGTAIAHPLLVDVSVDVEGAVASRMYPRTLPDLFAEDELRVSGRYKGTGPLTFTIHGKLEGKPVVYKRTIDGSHPHAWTAPLWAQARVDHLLEQLELSPTNQTELHDEVIDLALAYNFVTPYTAFLAVPETELDHSSAETLAQGRARKQNAIAQQSADGRIGGEAVAINGKAPTIDPTSTSQGVTLDRNYTRNVPAGRSFDADVAHTNAKRVADVDNDGDDENAASGEQVHRHGCAGCASTGGDGAMSLILIGLVALRLRRRSAR